MRCELLKFKSQGLAQHVYWWFCWGKKKKSWFQHRLNQLDHSQMNRMLNTPLWFFVNLSVSMTWILEYGSQLKQWTKYLTSFFSDFKSIIIRPNFFKWKSHTVAGENKARKKPALLNASFDFNYIMLPSTVQLKVRGYIFNPNGHKHSSLVTMFKKMFMTSKFPILLT